MVEWSGSGNGLCKELMRTGVLGGTFDPAHLGHLIVAQDVMEKLGLDEVRFVPAALPWMKKDHPISIADHRLRMLEISLRDNPRFVIDLADLERGATTYTVDTLGDLRKRCGDGTEFFFILGADALMGFPLWREPAAIMEMATLVAVPRPGYAVDPAELERHVPGVGKRLVLMEEPCIGISALDIRQRVAGGRSIRYLVAPGVAEYIARHELYRELQVQGS